MILESFFYQCRALHECTLNRVNSRQSHCCTASKWLRCYVRTSFQNHLNSMIQKLESKLYNHVTQIISLLLVFLVWEPHFFSRNSRKL